MSSRVRSEILRIDPEQAIYNLRTMEQVVSESVAIPRFRGALVGTLSAIALSIAVPGVSAIVSWFVVRRRREIAIRMAVGASPASILTMIAREVMLLAAAGTIAGLASVALCQKVLASILPKFDSIDEYTLSAVFAVMAAASAVACIAPAIRAISIDPARSMRAE